MANYLVVVESPAKAKTIKKYLGASYTVKASVGHVKDLPKSKIGVDVKKKFKPTYEVLKTKEKVLAEIKAAAKKAGKVFLATDPDREGEAIAWHIAEEIRGKGKKKGAPGPEISRVLFNEITKKAIQEAIKHPLELNQDKFDAQQARRVLDRLVGYQISPILWKKVRRGISAGRVQSVAVRLVVEREREIEKFVPVEYWSIEAELAARLPPPFKAKLSKWKNAKPELGNKEQADAILEGVKGAKWVVASVVKKEKRRNPAPPFITSKLQQEAANKLGYTAKRTMGIAQHLYEGVSLGEEGQVALITYMRTDSVRLSNDAIAFARGYVEEKWGKDHLPATPNVYKSRKSSQDAHEAIRPTSADYPPDRVKSMLDRDEFRLYELIWNRFVASQMVPAVFDQTAADIAANHATFRATGQTLKFPGYLAAYGFTADVVSEEPELEAGQELEKSDDDEGDRNKALPPLDEGETLKLVKLSADQHFTQPPARYTEASLVKELEERGIGRPSTYAAIMSTIVDKEYVEKKDGRNFLPTELGTVVNDLLVTSFPAVLDYEFTAKLETDLDDIEDGKEDWVKVLTAFYGPFAKSLATAEESMRDVKREEQVTDLVCEKSAHPMVIKWGRMGRFLACSGYPECKNTMDFTTDEDGKIVPAPKGDVATSEICPTCGKPMVLKRGRFGRFIACSGYPECKTTKPVTLEGIVCPKDGGGLGEKRTKRGKTFYGCVNYPKCDFVAWDKPVPTPCPQCGKQTYLLEKFSKAAGRYLACPDKECGYRLSLEQPEEAAAVAGTPAGVG